MTKYYDNIELFCAIMLTPKKTHAGKPQNILAKASLCSSMRMCE
jgi:hypothetical protein